MAMDCRRQLTMGFRSFFLTLLVPPGGGRLGALESWALPLFLLENDNTCPGEPREGAGHCLQCPPALSFCPLPTLGYSQ